MSVVRRIVKTVLLIRRGFTMATRTRRQFKINQHVHLRGFTCGCYAQHGDIVAFRGYDWVFADSAEVFSCRGSLLVRVSDLTAMGVDA